VLINTQRNLSLVLFTPSASFLLLNEVLKEQFRVRTCSPVLLLLNVEDRGTLLQLAAVGDDHFGLRGAAFGAVLLHRLDDVGALHHVAEHHVLLVQPAEQS